MNSELHERTVNVLSYLVDVLSADDLSLLAWHCGVSVAELMPPKPTFQVVMMKEVRNECAH